MTKGIDAGPFGSPVRFRDLACTVDGQPYMWERPISTQQAGFVTVSQSRKNLPDTGRGRHLVHARRGVDLVSSRPLYCAIDALPGPFVEWAIISKFSFDSAWWVWNVVSNLTYDRWSRIYPRRPGRPARAQESALLAMQPADRGGRRQDRRRPTRPSPGPVPDQLFGLDRRGGLPPLARAGRVDPDPPRRRLPPGPQRPLQVPRLPQAEWLGRVVRERPDQFKLPIDRKSGETDH